MLTYSITVLNRQLFPFPNGCYVDNNVFVFDMCLHIRRSKGCVSRYLVSFALFWKHNYFLISFSNYVQCFEGVNWYILRVQDLEVMPMTMNIIEKKNSNDQSSWYCDTAYRWYTDDSWHPSSKPLSIDIPEQTYMGIKKNKNLIKLI